MEKEKLVDIEKIRKAVELLRNPQEIFDAVGKGTLAYRKAKKAFLRTSHPSKDETMALKNWIKQCSTIGELADAYQWVPIGSPAEKLILNRIYDLL